MRENQDKLEKLSKLLLEKETLNYQDVEDLLGRHGRVILSILTLDLALKNSFQGYT